MYTFTTARNRAECEQTVYIKKGGEKKKTQPQKNTSWVFFFFQETHLVSNPSHTTLIRHGMASQRAGWLFLSYSTRDWFHSGLRYHVSGTSKSLAELSEMLPEGKGQNKMNEERTERPARGGAAARTQGGKVPRQVLTVDSGALRTEVMPRTRHR